MPDRAEPTAENDAIGQTSNDRLQSGFVDLCASCGKNRFAHVPDPPDDYWPDCTTFVRAAVIDAAHIEHQRAWSTATFGPREQRGPTGPLAHIRKEVEEVAADPTVLEEWVDVIILAFDGAWRAGHEPQEILDAVKAKQAKNEARTWPDWRSVPDDEAIEHVPVTPSGTPEG